VIAPPFHAGLDFVRHGAPPFAPIKYSPTAKEKQ
jgi:hypothetical protein